MWQAVLDRMLRSFMRRGGLRVRYPDGTLRRYGPGDGPVIAIRDEAAIRRLATNPQLALGECYMDGGLEIEGDDLHGLIEALLPNAAVEDRAGWYRARQAAARATRRLQQLNSLVVSKANAAHHYDLTPEFYDLFLDPYRQYTCGYFRSPEDTLEQAQAQKMAHIARKLLIRPGMRVLDIGCGWGGLAFTLAREWGARVVGITLSETQLAVARRDAEAAGLSGQVEFRLQDYREVTDTFDRVVSVGMMEHVGLPQYGTYFRSVRDRLMPDGVALIHVIGNPGPPAASSPWVNKYIFPGAYIPALSEAAAAIERSGLSLCDLEVWRLHYARTLRHWFDRFAARADEAEAMHDARFVRMWKYYLAGFEVTFRHGRLNVWQFQLARRADAVPVTRDYLYELTSRPAA